MEAIPWTCLGDDRDAGIAYSGRRAPASRRDVQGQRGYGALAPRRRWTCYYPVHDDSGHYPLFLSRKRREEEKQRVTHRSRRGPGVHREGRRRAAGRGTNRDEETIVDRPGTWFLARPCRKTDTGPVSRRCSRCARSYTTTGPRRAAPSRRTVDLHAL